NRSHWSTSKTPSYTKSVSWQHHHPFDFTTARENSKKNLLEAERNDNALLVKPADVRWNMGFRPDDEKSEG
ncbi:hypothetical protein FD846_22535, partial [Escherichia coli]|nr:hypothetical protein [Escherichia coli]